MPQERKRAKRTADIDFNKYLQNQNISQHGTEIGGNHKNPSMLISTVVEPEPLRKYKRYDNVEIPITKDPAGSEISGELSEACDIHPDDVDEYDMMRHQHGYEDEAQQLEKLEVFAKDFKQKRIKMGFTQGDVGLAMGKLYGNDFSQTTISRFEALNLSFKNMCKLKPLLECWLKDTNEAISAKDGHVLISQNLHIQHNHAGRKRKKRTSIDTKIKSSLDEMFLKNSKPTSDDLHNIAEECNLEKEVVRVWFCNRRQKEKRINLHDQQAQDQSSPDSPPAHSFASTPFTPIFMQSPEQNSSSISQSLPWQLSGGEGPSKNSAAHFITSNPKQRLSSLGRVDQERPLLTSTYPSILPSSGITVSNRQNQHILLSVAAANSSSVPLAISALQQTSHSELLPPPPVHVPNPSVINLNMNDYKAQFRSKRANATSVSFNALSNNPT